jgi:hypothetical protein
MLSSSEDSDSRRDSANVEDLPLQHGITTTKLEQSQPRRYENA